jgi:hypothetical protein
MAEEAGSGDALNVRLHRGRLGVRVESVESAEPELKSGGGRSNK